MQLRDKLVLILHEYRYEKSEWIISVILQSCIFCLVLFLFTVALNIEGVSGSYFKRIYADGYYFELIGYTEEDSPELEKMGFRDVQFSNYGGSAFGTLDELDHIWRYKIRAVVNGKDIWNQELEEGLLVVLFCRLILGAVGTAMLLLMIGNVSNSVSMKLMRRQRYIRMLEHLGGNNQTCRSIFFSFFAVRNFAALTAATIANGVFIHLLNGYINRKINVSEAFSVFDWRIIVFVLVISMLLIWETFRKHWRQINAF